MGFQDFHPEFGDIKVVLEFKKISFSHLNISAKLLGFTLM